FSAIGELRPPHKYLQSFSEFSVEMLFNKHIESLRFLDQQGFIAQHLPIYNFRQKFLKEFLEAGKRMKSFLSPVKLIYLMYFGNKTRFTKTIQEQFLAKQLRLP
ncbi:MAG: hypothetical protein ABJA66_13315, partial [Actinomycetota bacterium]